VILETQLKAEDEANNDYHRDQLNKHNLLEHDASLRSVDTITPNILLLPLYAYYHVQKWYLLICQNEDINLSSRSDAYFGNNYAFNQTVFDETRKYWTGPILNANMLANSKVTRQVSSKAFNPTYVFTLNTEEFSLGEVAASVIAFGDLEKITVNRSLVEYFFGT
jgi:hypothetical protein